MNYQAYNGYGLPLNMKIDKTINFVIFIIFIYTLYFVKEASFLFYSSFDSPDFNDYFSYFDYFFYQQPVTGREQGLSYYSFHSWYLYFFDSNYIYKDIEFALNRNIQNLNFLFFCIGLLGIYFLLDLFKYNYKSKMLTLTTLSFMPLFLSTRIVLKPEILSIAFLPWLIYFIELYLKNQEKKYLFFTIPLLVTTFTSKGSIFIMIGTCLTLFYIIPIYKINKKTLTVSLFAFLLIFLAVSFENNEANGKNLFSLTSGAETRENYDYKASPKVIYEVNLYKLFSSPIKHEHANSLIGITLLETYGDYFDLYWDNNASAFSEDRLDVFYFEESKKIKPPNINLNNKAITFYIQNLTDIYPRRFVGLIISILIYYSLIKGLYKKTKQKKFLSFILIGIALLALHAVLGIPNNNFDPLVGDTFKPIYYSFLALISFSFLLANFFEKSNKKYIVFLLLFLSSFYVIGFPKNNTDSELQKLSTINEYSSLCEINNLFILANNYYSNCSEEKELSEFDERYNMFLTQPRVAFWNNFNIFVGIFVIIFATSKKLNFKIFNFFFSKNKKN